jgi:ubiquitin-protein ligase
MLKWEIFMDGPEQSIYAVGFLTLLRAAAYATTPTNHQAQGGHFKLLLTLPADYPFKPPVLNFQTKIYHPNITNDDKGSMCLGMLRADEWKPPNKILAVLNMARNLLVEPNPDDAVETSIAEQYKNNRKEFEKQAKEWTKKYANGK